jgi:hypothetical protein
MATLPGISTRPATAMYPNRYGTPAGNISMTGNTALLGDDSGLSSVDQYGALLRSDNPLLQMARGNAMNYANAVGAGVDSASYGYNAERGMAAQLQPLVQQDAENRLRLEQGNQDSLNRMALAQEGTRGQLASANIARASAMDQLRAQFAQSDRERAQSREWEIADQDTQARASARSQFFGALESAMFSDPSFWRDPQGVIGAFTEYGTNFDSIFQAMFPEYFDTNQTVPPGGP